jgi:hypothetical protein
VPSRRWGSCEQRDCEAALAATGDDAQGTLLHYLLSPSFGVNESAKGAYVSAGLRPPALSAAPPARTRAPPPPPARVANVLQISSTVVVFRARLLSVHLYHPPPTATHLHSHQC